MASVNKVILIGNLGADPELRTFPSGGQICNIRIATTEQWKDRQTGEKREHTEWHNVVFNERLAEIAGQYLRKGSAVYVEGRLRTRKWQDQNGNDRYMTEIRADSMQMLGGRNDSSSSYTPKSNAGAYNSPQQQPQSAPSTYSQQRMAPQMSQAPTKQASSAPAQQFDSPPFNGDEDIPF